MEQSGKEKLTWLRITFFNGKPGTRTQRRIESNFFQIINLIEVHEKENIETIFT